MGLRMKNFWGSLKNPIFRRGFMRNRYIRGDLVKNMGWCFWGGGGGWYPNAHYELLLLTRKMILLKLTQGSSRALSSTSVGIRTKVLPIQSEHHPIAPIPSWWYIALTRISRMRRKKEAKMEWQEVFFTRKV